MYWTLGGGPDSAKSFVSTCFNVHFVSDGLSSVRMLSAHVAEFSGHDESIFSKKSLDSLSLFPFWRCRLAGLLVLRSGERITIEGSSMKGFSICLM